MLLYLYEWLSSIGIPGERLLRYVTFRAGFAFILAFFFTLFVGKRIICLLQKKQIGEVVRSLGLEGENEKKDTPTMGGLIIISAILLPTLLLNKLSNIYIILMIVTTLLMGALGFLDDYIKTIKKDKKGLLPKYKIIGQLFLGMIIAITFYASSDIAIRENIKQEKPEGEIEMVEYSKDEIKSTKTTIPFVKNNNFDYADIIPIKGPYKQVVGWGVFFLLVVLMVTFVSNSVNLTDGIDGLAAGTVAPSMVALSVLAYVSSHIALASYLNTMFIPGSEELVVFAASVVGACMGFLWYNSYPAQIFMGDTGSLALGGIIAVFSILIRKELLLPILCAIFFAEGLSSLFQVAYFKYTKKKTGKGMRIFKMSPLHHHFQKPGNSGIEALIQKPIAPLRETKITVRFWLIALILAVAAIVTLKVR